MKNKKLEIELSWQAREMLRVLAGRGIYGVTEAEVARRIVDAGLVELVRAGMFEFRDGKPVER